MKNVSQFSTPVRIRFRDGRTRTFCGPSDRSDRAWSPAEDGFYESTDGGAGRIPWTEIASLTFLEAPK